MWGPGEHEAAVMVFAILTHTLMHRFTNIHFIIKLYNITYMCILYILPTFSYVLCIKYFIPIVLVIPQESFLTLLQNLVSPKIL